MKENFDIIENTYYWRDRFDLVLDSHLFDTIQQLQILGKGEHQIWQQVVWGLLNTYLTRHRFYHFRLSYGNLDTSKTKRQLNYEKYISMLEYTDARKFISRVCIASIKQNRGWDTLQKLKKVNFRNYFRLGFLLKQLLAIPYNFSAKLEDKLKGKWYALEILGLFHSLTKDEIETMLSYLQKSGYEWGILYFTRVLTRPGMIPLEKQKILVEIIAGKKFVRDDIYQQVMSLILKLNLPSTEKMTESLKNPSVYHSSEVQKEIISFLGQNPSLMKEYLSNGLFQNSHSTNIGDEIRKNLGIVNLECIKILLEAATDGDDAEFSRAETILRNITLLSPDAQLLILKTLNSMNPRKVFLAACTMVNSASQEYINLQETFFALIDVGLGPDYLEMTNDAYQSQDKFQASVIGLLLEIGQYRPELLKIFFLRLQTRWFHEFETMTNTVFDGVKLSQSDSTAFTHYLVRGDIDGCRNILQINQGTIDKRTYDNISDGITCVEMNEMLFDATNESKTFKHQFARTCLGYLFRVWPCLIAINERMPSLTPSNHFVFTALLVLSKPRREGTYSPPIRASQNDSFLSVCRDIEVACKLIEPDTYDEQLALDIMEKKLSVSDRDAKMILSSIASFPRANDRLLQLIRKGLNDRYFKQESINALLSLPRLNKNGVDLIIECIVNGTMSFDIVKNPKPIDPSAIPTLVNALQNRKSIIQDDVKQLWLFIYAIKTLSISSGITEDVINICKDVVLHNTSIFEQKMTKDERPYAIWVLGRVRPIRAEILNLLNKVLKSSPTKAVITNYLMWSKVAAAVALAEIASDKSTSLTWPERESIADAIAKVVNLVNPESEFSLFGGENMFPDSPSDAVYDAANILVSTLREYWALTDYEVFADLY